MADTDLLFRIIAQDEAKQALAEARAEVDKMTEAEKMSVKAAHEAQDSDKALAESKRQVIDATDKATESSNRWFKSLVDVKAGIDIARGIAEPIMNVAKTAIQAASDLNETKNKIDTLFGSSSNAIQQWAQGAATGIGQSTKQALDAASSFGVFGKAAGLAGDSLAEFAQDNVKLASDMASFFNTSPEDAIQAIGAAFRGESEPIRRYGVLIDEASLKQEAMKLGLISTTKDALQPQQRVLAAQALILQQTGAAQGDFAKTADGLANSQRIARAELENTMASIGERFLPIAQKGVGVVNSLLGAFNSLPKPMQDVVLAFGGIAVAAGPVMAHGKELVSVFDTIKGKIPDLIEGIKGFDSAWKATEIGIIIAGLIAIVKYIDEVGVAAKATSEDLIKMSQSGDIFKQAAASTEIMINGQERLNKVVRDVGSELKEEGKSYEAYRAGVLGAAVAAGTLTQAQADELIATGKVTDAWYRQIDVTDDIIQKTGLQSRAVYEAVEGWGGLEKVYKVTTDAGKQLLGILIQQPSVLEESARVADVAAARYQAMGEAFKKIGDAAALQSIELLKTAMGGAVTKEMEAFSNKQEDLAKKAAKVKEELDKLEKSQGAVATSTKKQGMSAAETALAQLQLAKAQSELDAENAKGTLSAEQLAAAQAKIAENREKLSGATKKEIAENGQLRAAAAALSDAQAQLANNTDPMKQAELAVKVENLKEKLGQASGAVVSYVDNSKKIGELKGQYDDINKEIAANVAEHEKATKTILFDIAAQQLATIQDPQLRAKAMNELALQWGLVDKATYDATTEIIGYTDKLAKDKNIDAFKQALQGVYRDIAAPPLDPEAASKALAAQTEAAQKARTANKRGEQEGGADIPKDTGAAARAQQALDYENKNKQAVAATRAEQEKLSVAEEKASREMKGHSEQVVGGYNAAAKAAEATQKRTADMNQQAIAGAQARSTADEKASREMKGHVDDIAESYKKIPAVVETEIKQKMTIVTEVEKEKAVAGDSPEERRAQAQAQKKASDTGATAKKVADDLATAGKSVLETLGLIATGQSDKVKTAGNSILDSFKNTTTGVLGYLNDAANTANKDMGALAGIVTRLEGDHIIRFIIQVTGDEIPSIPAGGNVPGRQHGGPVYTEGLYHLHADEYVLSAPMRYGQQAIPQQAIPSARGGGNTNITTNNFYDAAATKLWQEKQRLDRVQSVLEAM